MSGKQIIFKPDEVENLRRALKRISEDTLDLNRRFRGQSGSWGSIPIGGQVSHAQWLLAQLSEKSDKLEYSLKNIINKAEQLQNENRQASQQWGQMLTGLTSLFGFLGGQSNGGSSAFPPAIIQMVTRLIDCVSPFMGRDGLKEDPVVKKLELQLKQGNLPSDKRKEIEQKLSDIFAARNEIAKAQTAYSIYKSYGNTERMEAAHQFAEAARARLKAYGVDDIHYGPTVNVSKYYKKPAIEACDYDPTYIDRVPLDKKDERYLFLLTLGTSKGEQGDWAKGQLQKIHQLTNVLTVLKDGQKGPFPGKTNDPLRKMMTLGLEQGLKQEIEQVKSELSPDEYYQKGLDYYKHQKETNLFFTPYNNTVRPMLDGVEQMVAAGAIKKDSAEYKRLVGDILLNSYTDGDLAADNYMYIREHTDPGALLGVGLGAGAKAGGGFGKGLINKLPRSVPSLSGIKEKIVQNVPSIKNPLTPEGFQVPIGKIADTKALPKNDRQKNFNEIMGQGGGGGSTSGKPKDMESGKAVDGKSGGVLKSGDGGPGKTLVNYGEQFGKIRNKKILKSNIEYTDGNGYKYTTDGIGRISNAQGQLQLGEGERNPYAQRKVGGTDRLSNDDGGHLIGNQFKGSGEIDNLVPQNSGINRSGGEWYKMEQQWANALKEGSVVKVDITPNYSGNSLRPDSFKVKYSIDGKIITKNILNSKDD